MGTYSKKLNAKAQRRKEEKKGIGRHRGDKGIVSSKQ
jgi:hypothetical protein